MDLKRIVTAVVGVISILIGALLLNDVFDGSFFPPVFVTGIIFTTFGVATAVTSFQSRYPFRTLLEYEVLGACLSLFLVSGYVVISAFGTQTPLARFFGALGGLGLLVTATLITIVIYLRT